jgi:uridine phosphorylase
MVRHVVRCHDAARSRHRACCHTRRWEWSLGGIRCGIVGRAVGGSFAVLVAEQLFASGCEVLLGVASAGQIADDGPPPYHVLVGKALRDEGTSYRYLPPSPHAESDPALLDLAADAFARAGCHLRQGRTWTTDAPFRETARTIAARRAEGILTVEMEAAVLYAFAASCRRPVLCLAHVTKQFGRVEGDFEKGEDDGACGSTDLIQTFAAAWPGSRRSPPRREPTVAGPPSGQSRDAAGEAVG